MAGATQTLRDPTMTRKSHVLCPVEPIEPRGLPSAVRAATALPKGLAPVAVKPLMVAVQPLMVAVQPLMSPGDTVPTTTVRSATGIPATTGNPTAALENALDGSYVKAGRS